MNEILEPSSGARIPEPATLLTAGDGDGLGSLAIDPSILARLVETDDSLIMSDGGNGTVFFD